MAPTHQITGAANLHTFDDSICYICHFIQVTKGQLISKANCQADDSPKKRTNEFVFTTVRRVFVRFLGESSA